MIGWVDKNGDGIIQMRGGDPFAGKPSYEGSADSQAARGEHGQRLVSNTPTDNESEVYIDRDIIVLANPLRRALSASMMTRPRSTPPTAASRSSAPHDGQVVGKGALSPHW